MRTRTMVMIFVGLLCAWPAAAQEQRGAIEGTVKDASGAVLPGATVEAKAPSGAVLAATSDGDGTFRFPSVAPGTYTVSASLAGFAAKTMDEVAVGLGQIKKLDFALSVAGVTESVQVSAESPLVDVKQSARQTNIRNEQVDLLPKGRDFTTLVTQAAGANDESKLGGLSIDGSSAGENRYIIDGVETTMLVAGTSGKNVIADFVEEVQVKSSGYTAEFGGATGGVINVLTKSGTNEWHGNALFNFEGDALDGGRRPVLRLNLTDSDAAEYINYPEDETVRIEPGFALGGPILRNRAWFFGAYQPALTTNKRTVNATTSSNPTAGTASEDQKVQVQYITANVSGQMSDSLRGRIAYNNSWNRVNGLLPTLNGSDDPTTNYKNIQTRPNYTVSANVDWVASPNLFFGVRGGYYFADVYDKNVDESVRYTFVSGNNLGFPEVPESLRRSTAFQTSPTNFKQVRDEQTRLNVQADGTLYGNLMGSHQLKFGVQADRLANDVSVGEAANWVRLYWNASASGNRGPYGYYRLRSNRTDLRRGFITEGNIATTNVGLFLQDAWTINNRLTVNIGVRTEREIVPNYAAGAEIDGLQVPENGIEFDFADKLAPRVGFAYDIKGDGRWKAFGSWGVFYDVFKLQLPRGAFGGDQWIDYYYTLDTYDWSTLAASEACPPACPGRLFRRSDFRAVSIGRDAIDPDLKPMRQQEWTAGIDHQLNDVMAVSVRYVHKQVDRAIEDTQTATLGADGTEIYIIANPGEGLASIGYDNHADLQVAIPKPVRDYDSVEFAVEKRFSRGWYLRSSYLWSRLYGNFSGLSQSDENGRTSPNVGRLWDYPMMMFKDGGVPDVGPLATDRPHQFKTQFIYQLKFGTSLGVNQYVASGLPVSRLIGIYPGNNLPVQYLGRGSDGRTPTFSQTDLLVQHEFRLQGSRRLQLSFNVLNLLNQDTATSKFSTYHKTNGVLPNEDLFYRGEETLAQLIVSQNVTKDARFLMDNAFQAPIQARFGVKFMF